MAPVQKRDMLDPEAEMRRKFKLRCRFRAIGRLVQANVHWMLGPSGSEEYLGDDVKRRVAQAIRGRAPAKKQLLNMQDKALLNKPAEDRTEKEKQYLYRIIGGLKCFKRYPAHVKRKLAAATYFRYYGPGRVIVRQHQEAQAMYFVVRGDVAVSQCYMDELTGEMCSVEIGRLHAGDMFGEVSLLHSIPRTATATTLSHCEFLALMKEDFKNILLASIQKQWDEVKKAMEAFTYFDALDEVARREGCIMAKMRSYEAHETILGDGAGVANFVYFVLSGRCQMIESLQVTATTRLGKTYYRLYETPQEDEGSECLDFEAKYFGKLKQSSEPIQSISESSAHQKNSVTPNPESQENLNTIPSEGSPLEALEATGDEPVDEEKMEDANVQEGNELEEETPVKEKKVSIESEDLKNEESRLNRLPSVVESNETSPEPGSLNEAFEDNVVKRESVTFSFSKLPSVVMDPRPTNLKTYFMQVCQMNAGSSFGFGENMRNRRIVALTPVDCMLLPKIWLLQRNTANIWTRIEHFLNRKIPTTKQLFRTFVNNRQWLDYREQLVEDVVANSNTVNWTTVHDVPYSIRIEEQLDI